MNRFSIILIAALLAGVSVFFLTKAGWKSSENTIAIEEQIPAEADAHLGHDHGPEDLDERARLAGEKVLKAGSSEDIMAGVMELREILKQDSNHVASIEMLAELSVTSGQLDKAIERYEKLVSLQPENQEYRARLREICGQTGRNDCD